MKSKGAFLWGLLCFEVILPSCPIPLYSPTPILPWPFSGCFLSPFLSPNCVLSVPSGGFRYDCNLQTTGFFLTVNPMFPAEPRISYWHLKINLEKSNLSSIHHPLIQSTALELHISVIGSAIHLEISVIFHLLSVLLLSSKCLLITKDKPKLLNPVSKALCDLTPIYPSTFYLFLLHPCSPSWPENYLWFPEHTPCSHTLSWLIFHSLCQKYYLFLPVEIRPTIQSKKPQSYLLV